jgi:outer membrane receptor for ferrienterochelin and colicin
MSLTFMFLSFLLVQRTDGLTLNVNVADSAGKAAPGATVRLQHTTDRRMWESTTPDSGRVQFDRLLSGSYILRITKEGFYANDIELRLESSKVIEFTLVAVETRRDEVEVVARPEPINVDAVAPQQPISNEVIQNLPYTGRRDFLNAIALMPGVLKDAKDGMHIHGSNSDQIRYQLDGINVTNPSGGIAANIPIDSIENVDVELSGYSAEFGKGSGGIVRVESKFIGDRFRWDVTDFFPGINFKRKTLADFTPRLLLSGPIAPGRAWLMYSGSFRYDRTFSDDFAEPVQDQTILDQLVKLQWNLGESHVLTATALNNYAYQSNMGFGSARPLETTTNVLSRGTTLSVSNRNIVHGTLLETTVQWTRRKDSDLAKGSTMLVVRPTGWSGNFYADSRGQLDRVHVSQTLAFERRWGSVVHRIKAGGGYDNVISDLNIDRRPFQFLSTADQLELAVAFEGDRSAEIRNHEFGFFLQDRMILNPRIQLELGVRGDAETVVGRINMAPRWGVSFLPLGNDRSKISAGAGLFFDNVPLENLQLPQMQYRVTAAYRPDGSIEAAPAPTAVRVESDLKNSLGVHWNVAWEHEWAPRWVSRINFIQKRGHRQTRLAAIGGGDDFDLVFNNSGKSSYDAIELSIDRPLRTNLRVLTSYTYSQTKGRPALNMDFPDPSLEEIDSALALWHVRHRFLSWGYFPFFMKSSASFAVEARSGFPFSPVDQLGQLAGPYNGMRMPAYFVTNFSLEKEFPFLWGNRIAVRIGATNLFNRFNPRSVEPHVDSPEYLRLSDSSGRALVGRVRLIKK